MCTTVIRIFPSIPEIPRTSLEDLHNTDGLNLTRLEETVCLEQSMKQVLVCCAVYKETIPDLSVTNLKDIQYFYVDKITRGNAVYNIIDQPLYKPNLQADEVLEKI